jgi:chromosome segregation ATPase
MSFLKQILGRNAPSAKNISKLLRDTTAHLEASRHRLASAQEALKRVAVMDDAEHAAAEREQAEARRAIARLEARLEELRVGLAEAEKTERLEGLKQRAEAAHRLVEAEAPKALERYEQHATKTAEAIADFLAIETEVNTVNVELRAAGLPQIESPTRQYRCVPGHTEPEVRERRKVWLEYDPFNGLAERVSVFRVNERGEHVPVNLAAIQKEEEVVVKQERQTSDQWLPSLTEVSLPPARVGRARIWPKE